MKKFSCTGCGKCCRNFGDLETLPLFDDEKERFMECANQLKMKITFVPENVSFDKISGKSFCANWGLERVNRKCPFLDQTNSCLIYAKRGLICVAFPIQKIPGEVEKLNPGCFMVCKNDQQKNFVNQASLVKDLEKSFEQRYGKCSVGARKEIDKKRAFIDQAIKKLILDKKIDLVVEKKFTEKQVLGVFAFLKTFGIVYC